MIKKFTMLVALLTALSALAGCGTDEPGHKTHSASNGDEFNDSDVAFATDMIQHHAQALQMVDLTMGRDLDPEVRQLTEEIRLAQTPEIEKMSDWLTDWDQPIPETVRDHANAGHDLGDMDTDTDMPGMMSEAEMSELEAGNGVEFQKMWLEMMIKHHQGAIEMAKTERADGMYAPAIELADSIETSQQREITLMESLLDS